MSLASVAIRVGIGIAVGLVSTASLMRYHPCPYGHKLFQCGVTWFSVLFAVSLALILF